MLTTVGTSAELVTALKAASSGDTIKLAAGTYSTFKLQDLSFAGSGITITSADPAHHATLTGFTLTNDAGFHFSNLDFSVSPAQGDFPYRAYGSSDLSFDKLSVHGSLDGHPQNDVSAITIQNSNNISITNSEFQELQNAITHGNDNGLVITGNYIHDIRADGVHGGGSSNLLISNNTFSDFHPSAGDHPDAIQVWTTNTTASAQNITIENNTISRGTGDVIQGIFVTDQVGSLPYINLNINNNTIIGEMYNGIMVSNAVAPTVEHNAVIGFNDMVSWIRLDHVTGGSFSDNSANRYFTDNTDVGVTMNNEIIVPQAADAATATWQAQQAIAASFPSQDDTAITFQTPSMTGVVFVMVNGMGPMAEPNLANIPMATFHVTFDLFS
jgi:hypothetical protein